MTRFAAAFAVLACTAALADAPLDPGVVDKWGTYRAAMRKKVEGVKPEERMGKVMEWKQAALAEAKLQESEADAVEKIFMAIDAEKDPKSAEMMKKAAGERAKLEESMGKLPEAQRAQMAPMLAKLELIDVAECKKRYGEAVVKAAEARYPEYAKHKAEAMKAMMKQRP
ncbi:MAG: hypothetical protein K1X89_03765 [Myxococcaceae bacterium]|nr:hypothetical protein [Myxococcaceae bacterium]